MQKLQTTITPLGKEAFREAVELTVCADHEHSFYKEIITLRGIFVITAVTVTEIIAVLSIQSLQFCWLLVFIIDSSILNRAQQAALRLSIITSQLCS